MWEDLEELWNYDSIAYDGPGRDRTDGLEQRYASLYPYAYPVPQPVSHVLPSPRRLFRRWESGWY